MGRAHMFFAQGHKVAEEEYEDEDDDDTHDNAYNPCFKEIYSAQ